MVPSDFTHQTQVQRQHGSESQLKSSNTRSACVGRGGVGLGCQAGTCVPSWRFCCRTTQGTRACWRVLSDLQQTGHEEQHVPESAAVFLCPCRAATANTGAYYSQELPRVCGTAGHFLLMAPLRGASAPVSRWGTRSSRRLQVRVLGGVGIPSWVRSPGPGCGVRLSSFPWQGEGSQRALDTEMGPARPHGQGWCRRARERPLGGWKHAHVP